MAIYSESVYWGRWEYPDVVRSVGPRVGVDIDTQRPEVSWTYMRGSINNHWSPV